MTEPLSPASLPPHPSPRRRRRPWLLALAGAVVAMVAVGVVLAIVIRTATGQGFGDLAGGIGGLKPEPTPSSTLRSISTLSFPEAVDAINGDVQTFWSRQFTAAGRSYTPATMQIYTQQVQTGCGLGAASTGPFYCPNDATVYLDSSFFGQLATRFKAPGDFAEAYVIAHELGHHVQGLLGTTAQVASYVSSHPSDTNEISVRVELQADCFAGVWANGARANGQLEKGDLQEGLNAAAQVGDDTLQKEATGTVAPDQFTHGTSAQRVGWFTRGFESGDASRCDTFTPSSV